MTEDTHFRGAKLALFIGGYMAVIMRDEKPGLPWPGYLDLPGGGREGRETPEECALRETQEELGLIIPKSELIWKREYVASSGEPVWFFAAMLHKGRAQDVRFGHEGQYWTLIAPQDYLAHEKAIPHFATRVGDFLATDSGLNSGMGRTA